MTGKRPRKAPEDQAGRVAVKIATIPVGTTFPNIARHIKKA